MSDPNSPDPNSSDPNRSPRSVAAEQAASEQVAAESTAAAEAASPKGFGAATLAELRRVVWPSRQQLFSESVAVILMVGLSAAAIAAIDRFYGWASSQVFG
ncbi:Preprotein translocase SecE subunit [Cyanobium sp. NS01]|nr:Preprotein translocase SecE subunit [Cyanobium sp. NS01]